MFFTRLIHRASDSETDVALESGWRATLDRAPGNIGKLVLASVFPLLLSSPNFGQVVNPPPKLPVPIGQRQAEAGPATVPEATEGEQEAGQEEGEQADGNAVDAGDNDEKILDAFFDELEKELQGDDNRSKVIQQMRDELKLEYADLELQQTDAFDAARFDRMLLIAQYYQNLTMRNTSGGPSRMSDKMRQIANRTRQFRREHPALARKEEFRNRENELRNQVMQINRFGGIHGFQPTSLKDTMISLSSNGKVVDRWAPKRVRAHPGEADGTIQAAHFTMRRLLRLHWRHGMLAISRDHWNAAFAGQSPNSIQTDVNHLMEKRGIEPFGNEDEQQQMMRRMQRNITGTDEIANLGRLFQEFIAGGGRSYSGGGNSGHWSTQSTDVAIRLEANPTDFSLSFTELQYPRRLLRVQATADSLTLVLLGDFIHRYRQEVDAKGKTSVQVTELLDDEIVNYKAANFAELYREHPRYVEDRFLPLVEHLGIVPPLSRFDSAISSRVVELLAGDTQEKREQFEEIAKRLDVDKFTQREAAFRELQTNLDDYLPLLFEKSKDPTLSREARARIQKLIEIGNQNGTAELDATIGTLGLTTNVAYLSELAETLDEVSRNVLRARVDHLTN